MAGTGMMGGTMADVLELGKVTIERKKKKKGKKRRKAGQSAATAAITNRLKSATGGSLLTESGSYISRE